VRSRCQRGHRQLVARCRSSALATPSVALGVLDIDRVDLVGHRRQGRPRLPHRCAEVTERDVSPRRRVEIDEFVLRARRHERSRRRSRAARSASSSGLTRGSARRPRARPGAPSRRRDTPRSCAFVVAHRVIIAEQRHGASSAAIARRTLRGDVRTSPCERGRRRRLAVACAREHRHPACACASERQVSRMPAELRAAARRGPRAGERHAMREVVDSSDVQAEVDELRDPRADSGS